MPELPEVETLRLGLDQLLVGQTVSQIERLNPNSFSADLQEIDQFVLGAKVTAIRRRAKLLIIDLSSGYSLVVHLKMTGQLVFRGRQNFAAGHPNDSLIGHLPDRSTRVIFQLGAAARLFYNDQRKFGWIKLLPTALLAEMEFIRRLGPEPLERQFTPELLAERLKRRPNSPIKAVLLDQSVIAGIGNIYADESLWGAKIHPATKAGQLTTGQISRLQRSLVAVLKLSLAKGGSTDRNYVDAEGRRGSYLSFARVFRRQGQPCPRCGQTILKIRLAGRGTHYCPFCQPPPRAKIVNK